MKSKNRKTDSGLKLGLKLDLTSGLVLLATGALLWGCVDHRPIRNGLRDEQIYLDKTDLTQPNPKLGEDSTEDGWLYRINVVQVSDPNIMSSAIGWESNTRYVRFRFREDALQVVDNQHIEYNEGDDPYVAERVMLEFPGTHVDVKLRESLDGERTNFLEENYEQPWQQRQKFKVDFEQMTLDPEDAIGMLNGYFVKLCGRVNSERLVPDSYAWDPEDQYLSFNVEVNYVFDLSAAYDICYSWAFLGQHVFDTNVIDTGTITYKFNFYRRAETGYTPEYVDEKDEINQRYGVFQILNLFTDPASGLLGAKRLMKRWNPKRKEPAVYYFAKGFPDRYKTFFTGAGGIKELTNAQLEKSGADLRVDFQEYNADGVEREVGDIRYSFLTWFTNHNANGPLGYGPSTADPRTGEVFSANVNAYNYAYDIFRFYTDRYLEDMGGKKKPQDAVDANGNPLPWEEIDCEPGETEGPEGDEGRLTSALFQEMRFVMDLPDTRYTGTPADFVPTPQVPTFREDLHRILPEVRYGYPGWNAYTFQTLGYAPLGNLTEMTNTEAEFQSAMQDVMLGNNPFGRVALHTPDGIEAQLAFLDKFRGWRKNHHEYTAMRQLYRGMSNQYYMDPGDFLAAVRRIGRQCTDAGKWESDVEFRDRVVDGIIHHLYIHEFGHTLGLRHNFYGTMDAKHMREGEISASVMDYVALQAESGAPHQWGKYDENAIEFIYAPDERDADGNRTGLRGELLKDDPLYCTDEHRILSPLCRAYDYGTTPAQIVLNDIENYDWNYEFRNRRAFRQFWNLGSYTGRVYSSIFDIQRMWYLTLFDWGYGGVQGTLKRLDQNEGAPIRTEQEYNERTVDFYNDLKAAVAMNTAFYDAIINQSASFRNYQMEYDPFYGDIRRLGIITDKLYATFAFMDLQDVYYQPNIVTYASLYDDTFGSEQFALSQRVLDNMLGSNYDTFPWFKYYALNIFAAVTNTNLVGKEELKERIAIRRFDTEAELHEVYPEDEMAEAFRVGNPQQTFVHNGEEYVYTYLPDRSWHLVAGKSRNPVSFQYMRDYNGSMNGDASSGLDNYGLKILLAYHEYFNNFQGF